MTRATPTAVPRMTATVSVLALLSSVALAQETMDTRIGTLSFESG